MFASAASRLPSAQEFPLRRAVTPFVLLLGALGVYAGLRAVLIAVAESTAMDCFWLDVVVFAAACLLAGIRYEEMPTIARPIARGIGGVVLVQVAFDMATLFYGPAWMFDAANRDFFVFGGALGLVAGIVALRRPSFLVPLFFHYVAFRHQLNVLSGVEVSETDYLSMLDVGEFAIIGPLVAVLVTHPRIAQRFPIWLDPLWLRRTACGLIIAWAIGAHLGNYFVSGWTKIQTGAGNPFFWLLHNPTQTAILIGLERGDNPLSAWPWLVQLSWDTISHLVILVNVFVLGTQILVPLAVMQRRLLMVFTVLFDIFHVVVYFTLGAAFFFWVAVNVCIYFTMKRVDDKSITPAMKIVAVVSVFSAHFLFYTSHLGWLDGAKLASPSFVAETRDGRMVPIPSVYFGIMSYSIAQTIMYVPDGHFPVRIGGNTYNPTDFRDSQSCGPQIAEHQDTGVGFQTVVNIVRNTDAAMRRHPFVKRDNLYYIYPHHMVANPAMFGPFNSLSMNDIVRYHYIVDSVCLSLADGHLVRDVHKTTDIPIDVAH